MKEFLLLKKSVPTIKSSYDTIDVMPEDQCDPSDIMAERILGHIRCVPKKDFNAIKRENEDLKRKLGEIWDTFYGQNMKVIGWHLNGDTEPIDNFFDQNDWGVDGDDDDKKMSEVQAHARDSISE